MRKQILIFAMILGLATAALAQQMTQTGPMKISMPGATAPAMLLKNDAVATKIGLTAKQKTQLAGILPDKLVRGTDVDGIYAKAKKVLTPVQISKLEQEHRHRLGMYSLTYDPYGKMVGLTATQKDQLLATFSEAIQNALSDRISKAQEGGGGGAPTQIQVTKEDQAVALKACNEKGKAILTSAQLAKWKKMA